MKRILLLTTALMINGGHVLARTGDAAMTSPLPEVAAATDVAAAPVLLASNDDACGTTGNCGTSFSDDSEDDSDDDGSTDDESDDDSGDDHDSDSDSDGDSDGGDGDGGDGDGGGSDD